MRKNNTDFRNYDGMPQKKKRVIFFSNTPLASKILYGLAAAIVVAGAIAVGVLSAQDGKTVTKDPSKDQMQNQPAVEQKKEENPTDTTPKQKDDDKPEDKSPVLTFIAPAEGSVVKSHSTEVPVWSVTLEDYRTHSGVDISTEDLASVSAACDGVISKIYREPLLGTTVVIQHSDMLSTKYSNLDADSVESLTVGQTVKAGDKIGAVGDSSISELCDEPHLHFEMLVGGVSVNPLDYLTEESKKTSLGIHPPLEIRLYPNEKRALKKALFSCFDFSIYAYSFGKLGIHY